GQPSGTSTNHRNVIFNNDTTLPARPLDSVNYTTPPALWQGLSTQCTGACDAVTIPHNTNESDGVSLQVWDPSSNGVALQRKYQVAAEIYQHKGASECYYDGTPATDPQCAFEYAVSDAPQSAFLRTALGTG